MSWHNDLYQWFVDLWLDVNSFAGWLERQAWPLNLLSPTVRGIANILGKIAGGIGHFSAWVLDLEYTIAGIFTWENFNQVIAPISNKVGELWNWYQGFEFALPQFLQDVVDAWNAFWDLSWPDWIQQFNELTSQVQEFFTLTLPGLLTAVDLSNWWAGQVDNVQDMIDSSVAGALTVMSGWQEVKDSVIEFLNNPWAWLWDRFEEWFTENF